MTFDVDQKVFVDSPGRVFEVYKLFSESHAQEVLKVVRRLQRLNLSVEERALLAAFTVVTPGIVWLYSSTTNSKYQPLVRNTNMVQYTVCWYLTTLENRRMNASALYQET